MTGKRRKLTENEINYLKKIVNYNENYSTHVFPVSGIYQFLNPDRFNDNSIPCHFIDNRKAVIPDHWIDYDLQHGNTVHAEACDYGNRLILLSLNDRHFIDTDVDNGLLKKKSIFLQVSALVSAFLLIMVSIFFLILNKLPEKPQYSRESIEEITNQDYTTVNLTDLDANEKRFRKLKIQNCYAYENRLIDNKNGKDVYLEFKTETDNRIAEIGKILKTIPSQIRDEKYWSGKEKIFGNNQISRLRENFKEFDDILDKIESMDDDNITDEDMALRFKLKLGLIAGIELYKEKIYGDFISIEKDLLMQKFKQLMDDQLEKNYSIEISGLDYLESNRINFKINSDYLDWRKIQIDWENTDRIFLNEPVVEGFFRYDTGGIFFYREDYFYMENISIIDEYEKYKRNLRYYRLFLLISIMIIVLGSHDFVYNYRLNKKLYNFNNLNFIFKEAAEKLNLHFKKSGIVSLAQMSGSLNGFNFRAEGFWRKNIPYMRFCINDIPEIPKSFCITKENAITNLKKIVGIEDIQTGDRLFDMEMNVTSDDLIQVLAFLNKHSRNLITDITGKNSNIIINSSGITVDQNVSKINSVDSLIFFIKEIEELAAALSDTGNEIEKIKSNIQNDDDSVKAMNISALNNYADKQELDSFMISLLDEKYPSSVQIETLKFLEYHGNGFLFNLISSSKVHEKTTVYALNKFLHDGFKVDHKYFEKMFTASSDELKTIILKLIKNYPEENDFQFLLKQVKVETSAMRLEIFKVLGQCGNRDVADELQKELETAGDKMESSVILKSISFIKARSGNAAKGGLSFENSEQLDGALSVDESPDRGSLSYNKQKKKKSDK
ncbi:MAG: hypothetical protein JW982_03025 [Spirochaetes bacterium]|nr:hypothetical protein [Spirochaetota bacterium]